VSLFYTNKLKQNTKHNQLNTMDKYLQIFLYISGFIVGMILLLYLLPKANCYEYDVEAERCILGDCTALKNLICCMKRDGDGAGIGPRRLRSRDAVDLQTIGAFTIGALTDPVAYLYNDTVSGLTSYFTFLWL